MTVPGVHLAVPVVGVYGLLLAPVWRQRAVPALLGFELLNCFVEGPELAKKAHVNLTQAHHFLS